MLMKWQAELKRVRMHKQGIVSQRRAIRALGSTSRLLERPLQGQFVAFHVASPGMIMFSVIHEEKEEECFPRMGELEFGLEGRLAEC